MASSPNTNKAYNKPSRHLSAIKEDLILEVNSDDDPSSSSSKSSGSESSSSNDSSGGLSDSSGSSVCASCY